MIKAVLFDLDGTLADTAPDLANALNLLRQEEEVEPLPFEQIRPVVSHGGIALIKLGFQMDTDHPDFERLRLRLLDIYRDNLSQSTELFPGMDKVIEHIENSGMKWGVVTNKPAWLTDPLMVDMGLSERAAAIVSGDTTKNRKPHPEPLFYACKQMEVPAHACLYVGDAERDIIAGRRAGMKTLAALFGYLLEDDEPHSWQADAMIGSAIEVLEHL